MMAANGNKEPQDKFAGIVGVVVLLLLVLFIFATSCSPRIIEHIRYQKDTTYIEKVQVDSIFRHDSVFVKERGDTIFIYKERVRERYKFLHDTVRVVRVDSVAVETVKEVKVEKPLTVMQSLKIRAFWWLLAGVVCLLLWVFRKPLLKLIGL